MNIVEQGYKGYEGYKDPTTQPVGWANQMSTMHVKSQHLIFKSAQLYKWHFFLGWHIYSHTHT